MAKTMHQHIKERCELAHIYAEDGAYATAATILEEIAKETREHANQVHGFETKETDDGEHQR